MLEALITEYKTHLLCCLCITEYEIQLQCHLCTYWMVISCNVHMCAYTEILTINVNSILNYKELDIAEFLYLSTVKYYM